MSAMIFIVLVAVGNFVLGFTLASLRGHGPTWSELMSFRAAAKPHEPHRGSDAHGSAAAH